jgi:hypothetical protein
MNLPLAASLLLILSARTAAWADTLAIPAFDRGWYSQSGFHDTSNDNYFAGDTSASSTPMGELRNWFVFDLSAIGPRTLIGASLVLDGRYWVSDTGSETYRLSSVTTPRQDLMSGAGGIAAFNSLGTGPVLGEVTRTGPLGDTLVIPLSHEFMSSLPFNGWLVLGGRLTTLDSVGSMFASSATEEGGLMPQLILDDGVAVLPLPTAALLVGIALLAIPALRPRRSWSQLPR